MRHEARAIGRIEKPHTHPGCTLMPDLAHHRESGIFNGQAEIARRHGAAKNHHRAGFRQIFNGALNGGRTRLHGDGRARDLTPSELTALLVPIG